MNPIIYTSFTGQHEPTQPTDQRKKGKMATDYIYISEFDRDMRNMYSLLKDRQYEWAVDVVRTALLNVDKITYNDARLPCKSEVSARLMHILCLLLTQKYDAAHNCVREFHFRVSLPI